MTADIFIRSYWKDLEWLQACVASIQKYCEGFRDVVVTLPHSSQAWLRRSPLPAGIRVEFCDDYRDDYLGQQVTKLQADTFTDADYICHVDADCIFYRRTTPQDFILDGRPRILKQRRDLIPQEWPWRKPVEKFLGFQLLYDFMRQPPFVFPRWLYPEVREHCLSLHKLELAAYVVSQPARGFSEFNVLGALAWQRHHQSFVWIDAAGQPTVEPHCRWYWSWGGMDASIKAEIANILDDSFVRA